jgi:hypothetical protein
MSSGDALFYPNHPIGDLSSIARFPMIIEPRETVIVEFVTQNPQMINKRSITKMEIREILSRLSFARADLLDDLEALFSYAGHD